ncbi:hypothetical protein ACSSS7_002401 [Eimeria intestinalis]
MNTVSPKEGGSMKSGVQEEQSERSLSGFGVRFESDHDSVLSGSQEYNESAPEGGIAESQTNECNEQKVGDVLGFEASGKAYASLVAETMRRTAPYGFIQSPDWSLPSVAALQSGFRSTTTTADLAGPILHSLKGSRTVGGSSGGRRSARAAADKTLPSLQQTSHVEAAGLKHLHLLYETCVKKSNQTAHRQSTGSPEILEEVEKLLALRPDSPNRSSQSQDLDKTGHADLTKIKTEQDAVAFFARHGSTTKTKFLFCNKPPAHPLEFDPYKLVVVPQNQVNPEHFTISPTAVMHICPGKPSECIRQDEWMRQAFVHSVLRSLPFFKTFVAKKILSLWSHASRRHMFEQRREMLCRTLFLAKPIYCDHLVQIHRVLAGVSSVKLVELQPILYDSTQFIAQQHTLRSDPKTGTGKELEAKHAEVQSLAVTLMQKLHEATQLPEVDPMQACSVNKAKSIFQAKKEAEEQRRLIRLAYKNQALLGHFILLVDLIFTTRLAKVYFDFSSSGPQKNIDSTTLGLTFDSVALEKPRTPLIFFFQHNSNVPPSV